MHRKPDGCPACGQVHDQGTVICPITGVSLRFSDPTRAAGQVIGGKYLVTGLLGRGGMGAVYEAEHIELGRKVAIKILLPESSGNPRQIERFKREARSAASIGHENIVQIFDLDTSEDGSIYIVMEHLLGTDLADLLHRSGKKGLGWRRTAVIALQAARGLGAAHGHSIVHRDLKPENVFIATDRQGADLVKIVDFGIAMMREATGGHRLTAEGVLIGTPFYMSPEQARGERELDARTDVYALGTVIYEMLTGTVLFDGDTYLEILAKHQVDPPPPLRERCPDLDCPSQIESMVYSMLQKERDSRPQTMAEVAAVLGPFASESTSAPAPEIDPSPARRQPSGFERTVMAYGPPAVQQPDDSSSGAKPGGASAQAAAPSVSPTLEWSAAGDRSLTMDFHRSARRSRIALLVALAGIVAIAATIAIAVVMRNGHGASNGVGQAAQASIGRGAGQAAPEAGRTADPAKDDRVRLVIEAFPEEAVISVNGERLEANPIETTGPRGDPATLEEDDGKGRKKIKVDKDNPYLVGQ